MSLAPGRELSHYRIVDRIGEGGMGVVWRATDSTLGRDVAIKVLPDLFAADPERLARFEREAKLLASLNHPNIAAIYGLHSAEGVRFLAMELVEGEDLAVRLERGALPVSEVMAVALQVANALEHAHERGVIHRDLKPGNIKLGAEAKAKVLDFGLAKALEGDDGRPAPSSVMTQSPTITGRMTGANVLIGTAAYMAPEQARGYVADKRADIWAFGVVLMEMLTGRRMFEGETISDTLASVLKSDPDWSLLPRETPARIRELLRRCLDRDPKRRLRDIGEARLTLDTAIANPEEPAAAPVNARRSLLSWAPVAFGGIALGALAMLGAARLQAPQRHDAPLRKFRLTVPPGEGAAPSSPVISPDGRAVAYRYASSVWIQSLDEIEPRELKVDRTASHLFWSPDSRTLGFIAGTRIMKIAVDGGEPQAICDTRGPVTGGGGASWSADGNIVFSRGDSAGLLLVPDRGGDPRSLLEPDSTETDFHEPYVLPGGRGVLFAGHRIRGSVNNISVWSGGKRKTLLEFKDQRVATPTYDPAGYIVFQRLPTTPGVWAVPFALSRLEVTGDPFLVIPGGTGPSVSTDGTLAAVAGGAAGVRQLDWWDRTGKGLGTIGQAELTGSALYLALARDGRRIAWSTLENENRDLWIYDTARGTRTRLTFDPGVDDAADWSPAGDRVVYHTQIAGASGADGLRVLLRAADGTGAVDTLGTGGIPRFSHDGRHVLYVDFENSGATWHLWEVALDGARTRRSLVRGNPRVTEGRVSPSGNFLAYMSDESGQWEVYLSRYPSAEGRWQVSTAGGQWPRWNAKGDRLYFVQTDDIMEVEVSGTSAPTLGTPTRLFTRPSFAGSWSFGWFAPFQVTGDGTRFLSVGPSGQQGPAHGVSVVQNWAAEFTSKRTAKR